MEFIELCTETEKWFETDFVNFLYSRDSEEWVKYRLMWNMCRDKYDKAIMMSSWADAYDKPDESKDLDYQNVLMKKCELIVAKYMSEAPRWTDLISK